MAKALIDLDNIIRCEKCGQRLNKGQVICPVCKENIDIFENVNYKTLHEKQSVTEPIEHSFFGRESYIIGLVLLMVLLMYMLETGMY